MARQRDQIPILIQDTHLEVKPSLVDLSRLGPQKKPLLPLWRQRLLDVQVHHQSRVPKRLIP